MRRSAGWIVAGAWALVAASVSPAAAQAAAASDSAAVHIYLPRDGGSGAGEVARARHTVFGVQPWYSRVDGARLAVTASQPIAETPLTASAIVTYAPVRRMVLGGGGARILLSRAHGLQAVMSATRWSQAVDGTQLDPFDNALRALVTTRETFDYVDLQSLRAGVRLDHGRRGALALELRSDRFRSLGDVAGRGLFTTPHDFRANPAIEEGRAVLARLAFDRDTRRDGAEHLPASWERVLLERADRAWGGDFSYTRGELELGVRSPVSPVTRIEYRVRTGIASSSLPQQRRFLAGGDGTLRGSGGPRATPGGTALLLLSAEATTDVTSDLRVCVFADGGSAWDGWDTIGAQRMQVSAGIGLGWEAHARVYAGRAWAATGQPWFVRFVVRSPFARPIGGLDAGRW